MTTTISAPVADNAHDGERIAQALRALMMLLSHDARVRQAFDDVRDGSRPIGRLSALLAELGLQDYERWLPHFLAWEFLRSTVQQVTGQSTAIEVTLPGPDAPWAERGRAPKRGDVHREDIARSVEWFYRHHVKQPPDSIRALAAEYARQAGRRTDARSVVQHGIVRVKALLAHIEPLPE